MAGTPCSHQTGRHPTNQIHRAKPHISGSSNNLSWDTMSHPKEVPSHSILKALFLSHLGENIGPKAS